MLDKWGLDDRHRAMPEVLEADSSQKRFLPRGAWFVVGVDSLDGKGINRRCEIKQLAGEDLPEIHFVGK
jgi:hypothetical protein